MSKIATPINSFTIDADYKIASVLSDTSGAMNDTAIGVLPTADLVRLYNANAARVGKAQVNRFADRETAGKRIWALVDAIVASEGLTVHKTIREQIKTEPAKAKATPKAKPAQQEASGSVVDKFLKAKDNPNPVRGRGVHSPAGETALPLREGSKQLTLARALEKGATMPQLMKALNWNEATVRSGFYWDLRRKGLGVRQEGDKFHLVLPEGVTAIEVIPLKKRGEA